MTQEENVYADTLNLLGSDFEPPEIQEALDKEHAKADPKWWAQEVKRRSMTCTA